MKDNLEKIIESAKRVDLSVEEKTEIKNSILDFINRTPFREIHSPFFSFFSVGVYRFAPVVVLLVVFLGGGTSYFAQNSLPGESLYPVKINVNEKLESVLAFTPESFAEVSITQASRRIGEAEALANKNLLTQEKSLFLQNSFSKKFDSANQALTEIENKKTKDFSQDAPSIASKASFSLEKNTKAESIRSRFDKELDDHEASLEKISRVSSTSPVKEILNFINSKRGKNLKIEREGDFIKKTDDSLEKKEISKEKEQEDDDDEYEDDDDKSDKNNTSIQIISPILNTSGNTTSTFTISDIADHNTSTSCYTVVSGSVYDVTSWISKHPGGPDAIKSICGIDATNIFLNQHGGQSKPETELASFKIGVLKK